MFRAPILSILIASSSVALLACTPYEPDPHPGDALIWPVGVAADPDGRHLYVANSNFDRKYQGGNIVVVDLETHAIVGGNVQTASYGGDIAVRAADGKAVGLYMTTREGNTVTSIKVGRDGDVPTLSCLDGASAGDGHTCANEFVFGGEDADKDTGIDPFGVAVSPDWVFATSFEGKFTVLSPDEDGRFLDSAQVNIDAGAYGLAVHPVTGDAYATTKLGVGITRVRVSNAGPIADGADEEQSFVEVTAERVVTVANPTVGRDFGRGLAFNADGTLAFAAFRTPSSLLIVDTAVDEGGQAADRLLDLVPLPSGPASVTVAPSGAQGQELVYVTLFNTDEVAVVDPARSEVIGVIEVGNAPFDITVVHRDGLKRAYVSLFEDNAVGVIELDPTSKFYHQEIARIP